MTYNVGYRKPPQHSRYKKGQSGNPKGRPKGSKSFRSRLEKALREQIMVQQGDKKRKVPKLDVLVARFVNEAARGDWKRANKIIDYILATEERAAAENPDPGQLTVTIEFVSPDGTTRELE